MRLELVLGNDEQDDEFYRRVIERVEFDSACRSSKGRDHVLNPIGRAMWNRDPETDAGAHCFLALLERSENAVPVLRFDLVETDEQIDELDDGRPTLSGLHLGDDLLGGK